MDAVKKQLALVAQKTETTTTPTSTASISMVRPQLRCTDDDDSIYAPQYVPIGPYHLSRSSPGVEKEKTRCAGLLHSLSEEHTKAGLTGLMEELELLARACYADGAQHMTAEQFASMLLHDGCYLLHFFLDYVSTGDCATAAPGDGGEWRPAPVSRNTLVRDAVFLVENQIPLFVLERLHQRVVGGGANTISVLDCIAGPVQELLQKQLLIRRTPRPAPPPPTCAHLLHLVHAYLQPTLVPVPGAEGIPRRRRRRRLITGRWRRATEYQRYANVRFKARELVADDAECSSILDVQLVGGGSTVWVPRLRVDSSTWTILRNLMALEEQEQEQQARRRRPVTAYCVLMSQVACTAEDVELLRRAGVVDHFLGDDEQAARGFAGLCRGVVLDVDDIDANYLKPLWHVLEERCHSRVQRLMGWFRHGHNVGLAAVLLLALVLVACQVMQTLYAAAGPGRQH
ncbi:hypothetical protein U9M48_000456 [Paspalum notatum var. saurae]|uniref:Uncharacterized protein n=1 Tax=Paspalum notatum var. saurae TaxID=547442 RepID=A0AAQ3PE19_PASNO